MIHSAKKYIQKYGFDSLYNNLIKLVNQKYINHKIYNHLELFDYSNTCQFEKKWNIFTKISRGLIINTSLKTISAFPLEKFHNYGEITYNLPKTSFVVSEKYDGSMGIIFYDIVSQLWHFSTRGSMESDQSKWMKDYFFKNIDHKNLNKDFTYICEIIYPENRVVVDYKGKESLVLLAVFDNTTGIEFTPNAVAFNAGLWGFEPMNFYSFSDFECLTQEVKTWGIDHEGVVVRFADGYRVKVKAEEYCRVHKILSNFSPLSIWESLLNMDDMDGIRKELPEEFWGQFDEYVETFMGKFDDISEMVEHLYHRTKTWSDKDVGMEMNQNPQFDKCIYSYVFAMRKGKFDHMEPNSKIRKSIFIQFRPTGNVMDA